VKGCGGRYGQDSERMRGETCGGGDRQGDGKKEGRAGEREEGGWGRGMGGRRA